MADVVVYTTPICAYCGAAKRFLERKGVAYRTVDVAGDGEKRAWLAEVTHFRTVPQIFINGKSIGGYQDMVELERQGELDALLAEPSPPTE